ncbi:S1 family peptidase [Streptomyces sp. NBC_00249]|uniref:S1 family peptidase n=1 Tax=Streptomyces sp. NBC_00249 TaxID=2975690 RepID=UPI0022536CAA|nr:S1 family peptidase [Streptomyces sp. NBC_00249]MCX5199308.1 S1 family peptidase [Streptomyces sp. NBC_00249]
MKVPRKALAKGAVAVLLAGLAMAPGVASSSAAGSLALPAPFTPQAAARAVAAQVGLPEAEVAQRLAAQDGLAATAKAFEGSQGANAAGVWANVMRGEVHANVVDDEGERAAKAAGVIPQRAAYTTAVLKEVQARLDAAGAKGLIPKDSSWGVDTQANRVRLELPASADGEALLREAGVTGEERAKVAVSTHQRTANHQTGLVGGDGLSIPGRGLCSAGIMLQKGGDTYLATAAHCVDMGNEIRRNDGSTDRNGNGLIGRVAVKQYPTSDYALIKVDHPRDWSPSGGQAKSEGQWFNIYSGYIANPAADMVGSLYTCISGAAGGWQCGKYFASGWSFTNRDGTTTSGVVVVRHVATQGGDSGGAVLYGTKAAGTLIGSAIVNGEQMSTVQPISRIVQDFDGAMTPVDWRT